MSLRAWRTFCYPILVVGLGLFLFSGSLPIASLAVNKQDYESFLQSIAQTLNFKLVIGEPVWILHFLFVIQILLLALIGLSIWYPLWRVLRPITESLKEKRFPSLETITQRIYYFLVISLVGLAIVGDLLALGVIYLIAVVVLVSDYPPAPLESAVVLLLLLLLTVILLGHAVIAFFIGRSHWRLLRNSR